MIWWIPVTIKRGCIVKLVKSKIIKDSIAEMFISEDGSGEIKYNNEILLKFGSKAWNNMKEADWEQEALIDMVVEDYIGVEDSEEFKKVCAELDD